jgi:hypothetical protein
MLDDLQLPTRRRRVWDVFPFLLFLLHLGHSLAFLRQYPEHRLDPDVLSYLVCFRNWLGGNSTLHGLEFFNQPKPLLVFGLGPLADVDWAFSCTAIASAALGAVVYLIGRDSFGRVGGLLWSLLLLLDAQKGFLTLKSSADLYLSVFLFLAIFLSASRRLGASSLCLLASALVKPVTIPCALHYLATAAPNRRRWLYASIPLLAVPLTLGANHLLLGSAFNPGQFLQHFALLRDGDGVAPAEIVHFALWTQLVKTRFVSTAPFGVLGLFLWLSRDRHRLVHPLLLVPLLFLGGYLLLAAVSPYMPFFRFFWPLEVWVLGFLAFGIVEVARHLALGHRVVQAAMAGLLLIFVADESIVRHLSYRDHFALPMQANMEFVSSSREVLVRQRREGEQVLVPLAFQPYLLWELRAGGPAEISTAEQAALNGSIDLPEWILHVPSGYVSQRGRDLASALIRDGGYQLRLTNGEAYLFALPTAGRQETMASSAG